MFQNQEVNSLLQSFPAAPRTVPLSVRLYLRLCPLPIIMNMGWYATAFGLVIILLPAITRGLDDAIPRIWLHAGQGKITNVEKVNFYVNENQIYAYHFEAINQKMIGICYGYKGKYNIGKAVSLQQAGKRYRVRGLSLTPVGITSSFIFLGTGTVTVVIGLCLLRDIWCTGHQMIHLLQYGTVTGTTRYLDMNPPNKNIGKKSKIKISEYHIKFEYRVKKKTYTVSVRTLDPSRFTDGERKVVLYDPVSPDKSLIWEGLSSRVRLHELTGQFRIANPLLYIPLLLAACIVGTEIVVIIILAIRAI